MRRFLSWFGLCFLRDWKDLETDYSTAFRLLKESQELVAQHERAIYRLGQNEKKVNRDLVHIAQWVQVCGRCCVGNIGEIVNAILRKENLRNGSNCANALNMICEKAQRCLPDGFELALTMNREECSLSLYGPDFEEVELSPVDAGACPIDCACDDARDWRDWSDSEDESPGLWFAI